MVDVAVRDVVRLLVDEEDALAVRILRLLGDAPDHEGVARLPGVAVAEAGAAGAGLRARPPGGGVDQGGAAGTVLDRELLGVEGGENLLLAEILPGEPRDLASVAAVAVDVGILAEERVGALRAGQPAYAPQGGQIEPRIVLTIRVEVADRGQADALQIEGLGDWGA